jgi:hypothetical protein
MVRRGAFGKGPKSYFLPHDPLLPRFNGELAFAVNQQIGFDLSGMVQDGQKILKDTFGPLPPTLGIGLANSCYFKPEMGISRMYEFHYSFDQGLSIFLILEEFAFLDSPDHNLVQGSGDIQTGVSWHKTFLL